MAPVELVLDFNLQHVYTGHVEGELLQVKGHERERKREKWLSVKWNFSLFHEYNLKIFTPCINKMGRKEKRETNNIRSGQRSYKR